MTKSDNLKELKRAARKIARARRIKHVGALELVAQELGFPHWNALTKAEKGGWRPTENEITTSEALVISENPFVSIAHDPWSAVGPDKFEGELLGHSYRVSTVTDDVRIWGRGWELTLPEPPLAPARFRVTDHRIKSNPIDDEGFRSAITEVASGWRRLVHCPHCLASPLDIHTSRWWLGEEKTQLDRP